MEETEESVKKNIILCWPHEDEQFKLNEIKCKEHIFLVNETNNIKDDVSVISVFSLKNAIRHII